MWPRNYRHRRLREGVHADARVRRRVLVVEDDPKIRRPDITKAKSLLGWEPKVPLEVGLKRTIDYFRKVLL